MNLETKQADMRSRMTLNQYPTLQKKMKKAEVTPAEVTPDGMAYLRHVANNRRYGAEKAARRRAWLKASEKARQHKRRVAEQAFPEERRKKDRERARKYQKAHRAEARERLNKWRRAHPESRIPAEHKRRARKRGNGGSYTAEEWQTLKRQLGNRCVGCWKTEKELKELGRKLVPDHIVPIAKHGLNDITNIQPLCHGKGGCNNKKHDKYRDFLVAW